MRLLPSLVLSALLVPAAQAQTPATQAPLTQAEALTRVFSAPSLQAEWFAPEFLAQAPLDVIQAQLRGIAAQYGAFVRLETPAGSPPRAIFERGALLITSAPLDAQGRLASFGAAPADLAPDQAQLGIEVLQKLLSVSPLDTSLFSAEFLRAVPAETLRTTFGELRAQLGEWQRVTASDDGWTLHFAGGTLPVTALGLDAAGKINAFRIGVPTPRPFADWGEAEATFAALGGQVSVLVTEVGQPSLVSLNAQRPLAVGSAFKLAILAELQAQVEAGRHTWTEELTLTDALKSLPSGTLQDAPAGSRYTLRDLAARMIRDSDNTATDLLLGLVGRDEVARRLGQRAVPSTREFFALKNPKNAELLRAYRAALTDTAQTKAVLARAATAPLPTAADFTVPLARDVEWFVSTERLCHLMNEVAAQSATQINPGIATSNDFARVSYKGGSEPGVLNLTTQVTTKAGKTYCVSATWNDAVVLNEARMVSLYGALLAMLR